MILVAEEKIAITAKRKKKLKRLNELLRSLGFTRVRASGNDVIAERMFGESLSGKPSALDYRIVFGRNAIEFGFTVSPRESRKKRLLALLPILLNAALLAEDEYEIRLSTLFSHVSGLFNDISGVIDKDAIDLASELDDMTLRYDSLSKKYAELVRSSEENARLLLECEHRRDELHQRTHELEKLSDELLKEEIYKWIKIHEGAIDLAEFCRIFSMPLKRAEEGLDILVREGYIKKRND